MSAKYETGRPYMATVNGEPNRRVVQDPNGDWFTCDEGELVWGGTAITEPVDLSDVRPLVVLDPEDECDWLNQMVVAAERYDEQTAPEDQSWEDMARAMVRSLVAPPKPPEPGRYGVVVAGDGREWFRWTTSERQGQDWCRPGTDGSTVYACWDDLEVLSIKRDGVQP